MGSTMLDWLMLMVPLAGLVLVWWLWRRRARPPQPLSRGYLPTAPSPLNEAQGPDAAARAPVQPQAGGGGGPTRPTLPR